MKYQMKNRIAVLIASVIVISCTSCGGPKKDPKPTPRAIVKVDEGNANAIGKGDNQADIPIVIASTEFSKKFNPFIASVEADKQVVDLTQISLLSNDRAGQLVYNGINGELRQYKGEDYTYYGASDLSVNYDEKSDTTTYRIAIRNDLVFSDGEKLTIDDVLFSIYAFCDNDYKGDRNLKNMPIQGLLNYRADSTKAEKFSEKKVAQYIKKNPKELKKWIKKNITDKEIDEDEADILIEHQARIFMAEGKGKEVKSISGINKINDYEMKIVTTGYSRIMSKELQIPICALHYYGDTSKYNVEKGQFGFKRGDISSICANKDEPLGAGAYRFIKYEDGIVYYTSNELYYLGCPKIAYLQLKDMTGTLEDTRTMLLKKAQEMGQQESEELSEGESSSNKEEINILAEVAELNGGSIDVISGSFNGEQLNWIKKENSNGELSGKTIYTQSVGDGKYYYIGINGQNVSVGKSAGSDASKNLRKALATVFSACRNDLKEQKSDLIQILNYPVASESWLSPSEEDGNYSVAYGKDISGQEIFEENEADIDLAVQAALQYLKQAGYQVENGIVKKAPKGASLKYSVWFAEGQEKVSQIMTKAVELFENIGITLDIQNVGSEENLQKKLQKNRQQIWIGSRNIEDTDFDTLYGSRAKTNCFGISDKKINRLIKKMDTMLSSSKRKKVYQKCFQQILDWAVEVPVCEYNNLLLFSSKRIVRDTIPMNFTPYYSWMNEIQKVEMK